MVFQGQDAWRRHPIFLNLWKDPLPGFKKAIVIYGLFVVGEYGYRYLTMPARAPSQKKDH
jgi:hypothetical protein